jgi:hypothetical protein
MVSGVTYSAHMCTGSILTTFGFTGRWFSVSIVTPCRQRFVILVLVLFPLRFVATNDQSDAQRAASAACEPIEAPLSFIPANGSIAPNMAALGEFTGTYTGPSPSATTPASLSMTAGRPTIQCPGDRNGGKCPFSTKQPGKFKEHFSDNHIHTYASYTCKCGERFPRVERGKAAFAKHISDNAVCQQ